MSFIQWLGEWLRKVSTSVKSITVGTNSLTYTRHNNDSVTIQLTLESDLYVKKTGDTVTGNINSLYGVDGVETVNQFSGEMAGDGLWAIRTGITGRPDPEGASVGDNGFLEIATADNGTEPIYISQYIGDHILPDSQRQGERFYQLHRSATLLDEQGNTFFPGTVTAASFNGTASRANYATNAGTAAKLGTSDVGSATQPIYLKGGVATACTYQLHKTVPADAKFTDTVYTHPTTSGNRHIPSGGSSGQILRWGADGTAVWGNDNNTTYTIGTASGSGNAVTALTISGNTITPVMGETFSKSNHAHDYLPLSGGTITGAIKANTFSGSWIGALKDGNAIISKIDNSNYSAWLNGYTKNYKVGLSSYPGSNDNVYLYSQTKSNVDAGAPNSRYKSLIWNADTGQLETDIVQTDIVQVGRIKVNTSFNSVSSISLFTSTSTNNNYREFTTYITNDSSVLSPQSVENSRIGNVRMWNLSDRRRVEIYAQNAANGSSFSSAITLDAFNNGNATCVYNGPLMKIGTSSVGSASVPVYLNQGTITACTQQNIYTRAINTSGFICFNNGIQICWSRRGVTQQGDNVITFPRAFKTAPFVVVSRYSNSNTTLVIEQPWIKGDPTTTQFNAYLSQASTGIYYIAIGLGAD